MIYNGAGANLAQINYSAPGNQDLDPCRRDKQTQSKNQIKLNMIHFLNYTDGF